MVGNTQIYDTFLGNLCGKLKFSVFELALNTIYETCLFAGAWFLILRGYGQTDELESHVALSESLENITKISIL